MCPDLYCRFGHGTPDDVAATVRAQGGGHDDSVVADCAAALTWLTALPESNGKAGIIGTCSGGRHAEALSPARPVPPIDYVPQLAAPLVGLFYYHTPSYRPQAAMDGWEKVLRFFGRHLG